MVFTRFARKLYSMIHAKGYTKATIRLHCCISRLYTIAEERSYSIQDRTSKRYSNDCYWLTTRYARVSPCGQYLDHVTILGSRTK